MNKHDTLWEQFCWMRSGQLVGLIGTSKSGWWYKRKMVYTLIKMGLHD